MRRHGSDSANRFADYVELYLDTRRATKPFLVIGDAAAFLAIMRAVHDKRLKRLVVRFE